MQTIRSFDEIPITGHKVLILCDIDETLLTWDKTMNSFLQTAQNQFPRYTAEALQQYAMLMFTNYRKLVAPKWTDEAGFKNLLARLPKPESRFAFLTARSGGSSAHYTIEDFSKLGIPYEPNGIFYTGNNISKGEFTKYYIDYKVFDEVIFIDDLPDNILSMKINCPTIKCFQFVI